MSWDVWIYRENIGWWLEEDMLSDISAAVHAMRRLFKENPEANQAKFACLILPSGRRPSDYSAKWSQ